MTFFNPCRCFPLGFVLCILFLINISPVHGQLPAAEQEALLDLVRTFNFVPFNWDANNASDACNWNQITCNNEKTTVQQINVNNLALGGYIPPSIGNLTNLNYLALSRLGLTGTVPEELIQLPNLQYLILESNQLATNLSRFTEMTALRQLSLVNNTLLGTIPDFPQDLQALYINVPRNGLTGTIPASLFQIQSLEVLSVGTSIYINGTLPALNMPNLRILTISGLTNITGTFPSLDGIPRIQELYLNNLRGISGLMPNMTSLLALQILVINGINITNCFETPTNSLVQCSVRNTLLCSDCKPYNCTMANNPTNCNPVIYTPGIAPDGSVIISPVTSTSNDGLSQDAIIAIATVIPAVVIGVAVFLIVFLVRRNKKKKFDRSKSELPEWLKTKKTTNPNFELLEKEVMKLPQKLFTPYEQITVKNLLGVGSFGQVFAGEWQKSQVALKISLSQVSDAFIEEIKLVSEMRPHPNIVQLLGYSIHPDNLNMILIMEFCNGGSLDTHLFDSNADISVAQKLELVKGIALGLNHLHANGIVHRDIAARNILLANGVPKLSDFGMSRQLHGDKKRGTTKADTGPVRWMAPESLKDQSYSPQSDVWMFGVLMFEVFARCEPHANEDPLEVGIKIRNDGYTPQVPSDVPLEVTDIMKRCWNVDPEVRPTMAEVVTLIKNLEQ